MLMYGFVFMFVVGTILSNMYDDSTGFESTRLAAAIDEDDTWIPVYDGRGFQSTVSPISRAYADDSFFDNPATSADESADGRSRIRSFNPLIDPIGAFREVNKLIKPTTPYSVQIDDEVIAYWDVVPPRDVFYGKLSPLSYQYFPALFEETDSNGYYVSFTRDDEVWDRFDTQANAQAYFESELSRLRNHLDTDGLHGFFDDCESGGVAFPSTYMGTENPCLPQEGDPRYPFWENITQRGWHDLEDCDTDMFESGPAGSRLTNIGPGNRCLRAETKRFAQVFGIASGRGDDDTAAKPHPRGSAVQSQAASDLERIIKFDIGEADNPIGAIALPFQVAGALIKFVIKALAWDYQFLQGDFGFLFKLIFLYPMSAVVVIFFIRLFIDAFSRLRSFLPI